MALSDAETYEKYAEELTRFATLLVGPDGAADAVASAVAAALGTPGWNSVENRRAYLYRAVVNAVRMEARRNRRREQYERRVAFQ